MKFLDNYIGPVRRPHRQSLKTLATERIPFVAYEGPYFRDLRDKMPEVEKRSRMRTSEYREWLVKHKLSDNESNRFHYILWLEAKDPLIQMEEITEHDA
jgi:hypothetical protein